MIDILSYGRHSPLGNTLDVPEEREPDSNYVGKHRYDSLPPCTCVYGEHQKVDPNCVYHGGNWVRVR